VAVLYRSGALLADRVRINVKTGKTSSDN